MKNFVIYNQKNGEIVSSGKCVDEDFAVQFIENCKTIEGVGTYFTNYVKNDLITEYTDSEKIAKSNQISFFHVWDNTTMSWIDKRTQDQINDNLCQYVKSKRNLLLQSSDWTDTASAPSRFGQEIYNQWLSYRQALRDIPEQTNYPNNVVWPIAPQ